MGRTLLISGCLLLASGLWADSAPPILARVTETRQPETRDPERAGYDRVRREVALDNLIAKYEAFVKPDADDQPIAAKYADHFFGLDFGRIAGNGGWDLWDFVNPTVVSPEGRTCRLMGVERQRGLNVLAEGQTAVADFLWELPRDAAGQSPGLLGVRYLKRAGETYWAYVEIWIAGAPGWTLGPVTFSSYPYNTSKTREAARERWVATNIRELATTDTDTALDPGAEWGLMLHNRLSQEDGGCLMVLDPEEVSALAVAGTYPVQPKLTPRPGRRSLRVAIGYWADRHWRQELPIFRQEAPGVRDRLVAMQFSLTANQIWDSAVAQEDYEYLLGETQIPQELRDRARQAWQALEQARGTGDQPLSREEEMTFLHLTRQCRELHRAMQLAWLENIGQVTDAAR